MVLLLIIFFIFLYGLILSQLTTCIIKFFFSQSCLSFEFSLQIVAMPIWFKMVFLKLKIKLCYQINACTISYYSHLFFFSNIWWLVKIHIQNAWHKAAKFFTVLTCLMPIIQILFKCYHSHFFHFINIQLEKNIKIQTTNHMMQNILSQYIMSVHCIMLEFTETVLFIHHNKSTWSSRVWNSILQELQAILSGICIIVTSSGVGSKSGVSSCISPNK